MNYASELTIKMLQFTGKLQCYIIHSVHWEFIGFQMWTFFFLHFSLYSIKEAMLGEKEKVCIS